MLTLNTDAHIHFTGTGFLHPCSNIELNTLPNNSQSVRSRCQGEITGAQSFSGPDLSWSILAANPVYLVGLLKTLHCWRLISSHSLVIAPRKRLDYSAFATIDRTSAVASTFGIENMSAGDFFKGCRVTEKLKERKGKERKGVFRRRG